MILELDDGQELKLKDSQWTVAQARQLKRLIQAGGAALSALSQGGGMSEELGQQILETLQRIDEAVRSDRAIIESPDGLARSIMDGPIK